MPTLRVPRLLSVEARWKRRRPSSDPSPCGRASRRPEISADIAIRPRLAAPRAHLSRRRTPVRIRLGVCIDRVSPWKRMEARSRVLSPSRRSSVGAWGAKTRRRAWPRAEARSGSCRQGHARASRSARQGSVRRSRRRGPRCAPPAVADRARSRSQDHPEQLPELFRRLALGPGRLDRLNQKAL